MMKCAVKSALAVLVALAPLAANAQVVGPIPPAAPDRIEPNPEQYMQSCGLGKIYGVEGVTVGDAKQLIQSSGRQILLPFGSQWRISSNDVDNLFCLHQTLNATVSLGTNNRCGDGCGYTEFDVATSTSGYAPCEFIAAGSSDIIKITPASFCTTRDSAGLYLCPLSRPGRCSAVGGDAAPGGPCAVDADCGSVGGVCDLTRKPTGVYMSVIPLATGGSGHAMRCPQ